MAKSVKPTKIYFYVYKVTHKETGMYYIGSRGSHKKPKNDLGVTYFSSSKYLKDDFRANPKDYNFRNLKNCKTRVEAFGYERDLHIKLDVVKDPKSLNKVVSGVIMQPSRKGSVVTDEVKEKISLTIRNQMDSMTAEERSKKFGNFGDRNPFTGKKHPPELRNMLTEKVKKRASEILQEDPDYFKRKSMLAYTEEARLKRYNSTALNLEVTFLDGKVLNFKKYYELSKYLGACPAMGFKLTTHPHLQPKYNILKMELKK